jgi:hypothetical protein
MDELQQLRVNEINRVMCFYDEHFSKYFATIIALAEQIPDQMNNEIRNAFSHLVRVKIVNTESEIIGEADKAIGHIERACRDCLKACIINMRDKINLQFDYALVYYKAISPQHHAEKRWITKERENIVLAETKGEKDLTSRLEELLSRMLGLQENLEEQYGLQPRKTSKIKLLLTQWLGAGVAGAIGKIIILFIVFIAGWLAKYFEII